MSDKIVVEHVEDNFIAIVLDRGSFKQVISVVSLPISLEKLIELSNADN